MLSVGSELQPRWMRESGLREASSRDTLRSTTSPRRRTPLLGVCGTARSTTYRHRPSGERNAVKLRPHQKNKERPAATDAAILQHRDKAEAAGQRRAAAASTARQRALAACVAGCKLGRGSLRKGAFPLGQRSKTTDVLRANITSEPEVGHGEAARRTVSRRAVDATVQKRGDPTFASIRLRGRDLRCRWIERSAVESERRQLRTRRFVPRNEISGTTVLDSVDNLRAEEDVTLATAAASLTRLRAYSEVAPHLRTLRLETKRTVADGAHGQHAAWPRYWK